MAKNTFTEEETSIIENEFKEKIEIIYRLTYDEIKTTKYVGYIILSNNVIVIKPKIHGIGFLNMLRYALDLPDLGKDHPELTKGENNYDLLVRFLFLELEKILWIGLRTGYKNYDDTP